MNNKLYKKMNTLTQSLDSELDNLIHILTLRVQ